MSLLGTAGLLGLNIAGGLLQRKQAKAQANAQYTIQYYELVNTATNLALKESLLKGNYAEEKVREMIEGLMVKGRAENQGQKRMLRISEFWGGYESPEFIERLTALRSSRENVQVRSINEKLIYSQIPKLGEILTSSILTTLGQKLEIR